MSATVQVTAQEPQTLPLVARGKFKFQVDSSWTASDPRGEASSSTRGWALPWSARANPAHADLRAEP